MGGILQGTFSGRGETNSKHFFVLLIYSLTWKGHSDTSFKNTIRSPKTNCMLTKPHSQLQKWFLLLLTLQNIPKPGDPQQIAALSSHQL